ncbi:hypothetical protein I552_1946 [Mycobacterium xenopi 3993]|nr:hypothetical protein I552_1946 [Mycobacterium xenopi 3993]
MVMLCVPPDAGLLGGGQTPCRPSDVLSTCLAWSYCRGQAHAGAPIRSAVQ